MKYLIIILLLSCVKEPQSDLQITMNYNTHHLNCQAIGSKGCPGTRDYEITAYNGDQFFKINLTTDTLRAGNYEGSFWYTNQGHSYKTNLTITIYSFNNSIVRGEFKGGIVSGLVNTKMIEI